MSTNYKEVPSWDVPDFPNSGPNGNPESDAPDKNAPEDSDSTCDAIEEALGDVEYQLGKFEPKPDAPEYPSRAQVPDVDAVTRAYTRSFTELAQRIDSLEKSSETESLCDEIRGLRQRLVENKDQVNRALDESVGRITALSDAVDNLTNNLTSLHDESAQLGRMVEDQLSELNRRLEFAPAHSDEADGQFQEAAEGRVSLFEKRIEHLAERLEQAEIGRDKKDYAVKQALTALLDKLSADRHQNENALAAARTSFASELGELRHALDASTEIIWEKLKARLSAGEANNDDLAQHFGQPAPDFAAFQNELEKKFESILDQLNSEKQRNADALDEIRGALASSLNEMKQGLDAAESHVERMLESRLLSLDSNLEDIARRLDHSENNDNGGENAFGGTLQTISARLEKIEQERDTGGMRFDEAAGEITRRLEQIERDNAAAQTLDVIVSDINRRLEKMERDGSADESALSENIKSMSRRLEQMEQDRDASMQPLNVIVGDIGRRLEKMETDNVSKLSLFEQSIADLKEKLATERKRNAEAQTDVRGAHDEPLSETGGSDPAEQTPAREFGIESTSQIQIGDHRPIADIIQELTASQTLEAPQFGAEDFNAELPALDEHNSASTEDLALIVPPSFVMPPIGSAVPRGPSMGELISGKPMSAERQLDKSPTETHGVLIEDDDYLSGEGVAMTSMADAANPADVPHTPLKPGADDAAGFKEELASPLQNGLTTIRAAVERVLLRHNRLPAVGAAILLFAGVGVFLFAHGQNPEAGAGVAAVDPSLLAQQTAMDTRLTGPSFATDEGLVGRATAISPALPTVEIQGPPISELTPAALSANAPGAPAMLENLIMQANAGSSAAALLLGLMYLNGDGVEANDDVAFWWLRLAAEQGQPIAQNSLGSLFERGQGVDADAGEAAFWYAQAADSGNVVAMHNLAIAHTDGAGVDTDLAEAARLFEEAANFGLADSQFNLAVLYSRGMGVPVSPSDAYKWYLIAAEQGDPEAGAQAEALAGRLAPIERDAAEAAAAAFVPRPRDEAANALPELAQIQ